jgi:stress response protein SCP2
MMNLKRGQKVKLTDGLDLSRAFSVEIGLSGGAVYDFSCCGLDADGKCSHDDYFVFYNNLACPGAGISLQEPYVNPSRFDIALSALPPFIAKLGFTATIDGDGTMGQIAAGAVSVSQNGAEIWRLPLAAGDFDRQKAIIAVEIYQKAGVWRLSAVANGFDGGQEKLCEFYGIKVVDDDTSTRNKTPSAAQSTPAPVETPPAAAPATVSRPAPAASVQSAPAPARATPPAGDDRLNEKGNVVYDTEEFGPPADDDWV